MVISDLEHLEDVNEGNLVFGGAEAQFTGSTSSAILGVAIGGGSTSVGSTSTSALDGIVTAFKVEFGSKTFGFTFPF